MSKRELFAVVNVYEKHENGKIKLIHKDVRLSPNVYDYSTEDGIKYASHWFHLKVTTFEGMVINNARNNE